MYRKERHIISDGLRKKEYSRSNFIKNTYKNLFYKSPVWGYEREWRLVSMSKIFTDDPQMIYKIANISRVFLGVKFNQPQINFTNKENKNYLSLCEKVLKALEQAKIKVMQLKLKKDTYEFEKIDD